MDEALRKQCADGGAGPTDLRSGFARAVSAPPFHSEARGRAPATPKTILRDGLLRTRGSVRMMKPVEQVTAWLFQVAGNRITDLFRRKSREALDNEPVGRGGW